MQFIDLKAQYAALEKDIRAAIDGVLAHGQFIMGPEVRELEAAMAEYVGVKHAIGCSSGTDALLLPLMAWGVGPGDAVFTTPFTFIATAEVVSLLGATPVFVDVDPRTFNIDPKALETAIDEVVAAGELRPRCVIPVDLFGLPADYDELRAVADSHGMLVLEDAAQSFGATYRGRRAGSLGHAAATSFFPAKPLGAYGDGGAVFTDDDELAARLDSIRVHGKGSDKYDNIRVGVNARLDTMQAAILKVKLAAFPGELERRQVAAQRYSQRLGNLVETPVVPDGYVSSWAQYSVLTDRRDHLQAGLKAAGVPTAVYYPKPLHQQTAYASLGYSTGDFPVSESCAARIISLPMHPYLDEATQDRVVDAVAEVLHAA
ncbi:MAG: DegT/DnrJ/EryC1/StrS family aminotransferase [Ectothiorhodospiraceae bacterium]|nr:DegT/DnrJ/EryC1/StrS family aminotransferase [Chromatiales bacterium]MCP5155643.1 DegT/DnrJ/EryC1/StrS family aminotransferase [Ectothiorhodospiraceae bacterium]